MIHSTPYVRHTSARTTNLIRKFRQQGFIDKIGMRSVTTFIHGRLSDYDTSLLEWIKLLPLIKNNILHGECACPVQDPGDQNILISGYRIRASVNVEAIPPYRFVHWGKIASARNKQGWHSGEKHFQWDTLEEVAVHTLAHECYHFLCYTGQLMQKNTEANANSLADQWLEEFRELYEGLD